MKRALLLMAAILLAAAAGGPPQAVNWPCVQRYVPRLTGSTVWPDFAASESWRADPDMAALVASVSNRMMPIEAAAATLREWAASHADPAERAALFAGLVDAINDARSAAIERIRSIDRRLQALADANARAVSELASLPAETPTPEREALTERRLLIIREYDSINRTVRYACEVPPEYEGRLGRFAKILRPASP